MANTEYLAQYEKENLRQIRLKINRKTEPELLAWIEKQGNIQGYIKELIRKDMEKDRECGPPSSDSDRDPKDRNPRVRM